MHLWQIYVADNINIYLAFYIHFLIFLSNFKQIFSFWTDIHAGALCQIHASTFSMSRANMCIETDRQTDGQMESNMRF
jgi:hypothetical protein